MWPWKRKKKKEDRNDEMREPTEEDLALREMERELDRMMPGMGKIFRQIREELERMMPEMVETIEELSRMPPRSGTAFRGVRIIIGPDGVPRVEQFGNVRKTPDGRPKVEYREPLTDIFEGEDDYTITVELPGVEKDDIRVNVDGKVLEIIAEGEGPFKYRKALGLMTFVDPKESRARFNNGILEIIAKKAGRPKKGSIAVE